jgi:hypothetical protein
MSFPQTRLLGLLIYSRRNFLILCVAGMCAPVTRSEIHQVVFSMNPSKASGLDSFSADFFQKA